MPHPSPRGEPSPLPRRRVLLVLLLAGCPARAGSGDVSLAETSYARGRKYMRDEQFDLALPLLNAAISQHRLAPDLLGDALLCRAVCYAEKGEFSTAQADLTEASRSVPPDLALAAQSHLFRRQRKTREADQAWRKAKQLNPHVRPIRESW